MTRVLLLAFGLCAAGGALAQGSARIPIQEDLRRQEEVERRLDRPRAVPVDRNVTPTNPSGVVGFDGPPGTVGDSVGSYGALPQGAAGSDIR